MTSFEEHTVRTNGVSLHTVVAGPKGGPLLVLLHGFPEFWYGWRQQIPALAAAGYRVVAPDLRGYNLSDKPTHVDAYTMTELVADISGLIAAFGRANAFVVGHDWGAAVAWQLAITEPDRVKKLVILNVPHPQIFVKALRTRPKQLLKSWYMLFFQLPYLPERLNRLGDWRGLIQALVATSRPGTFSDEDLARYREAWSRPGAFSAMLNWYRALFRSRPDPSATPSRVHVPTLVLWGVKDRFLSAEMAETSVALCDDGRLVTFGEATHWLQHEEPERVNRLILEFLGTVYPAKS